MEYLKFCFVFSCCLKFANSVYSTETPQAPAPIPKGKQRQTLFSPPSHCSSDLKHYRMMWCHNARSRIIHYFLCAFSRLIQLFNHTSFIWILTAVMVSAQIYFLRGNLPATWCYTAWGAGRMPVESECKITWWCWTQKNSLRFLTVLFLHHVVWLRAAQAFICRCQAVKCQCEK